MDHFACAASLLPAGAGFLQHPLPALQDPEGVAVPEDLPPVVDAHVHAFPPRVFEALWRWFDAHAWPVRYKLYAEAVVDFLLARGVRRMVLLQYAHRPGMARELNAWMADLVSDRPEVTGVATVLPGEPDTYDLLATAFAAGLSGVKLHCHVQCFAVDDPAMEPVAAACVDHDRPLVIHAGREPKSPAYRCDPHALCHVDRVERLLKRWPHLRLCVPHLGADEFEPYGALLERHDNLWLDTTMLCADYFEMQPPDDLIRLRPDRVLYGTDFPNVPYAWDRELTRLAGTGLSDGALEALLGGNAADLWGFDL